MSRQIEWCLNITSTRGVFGCADGPSLRTFFFARGIRFVRAFDTGPIKGRSGLEQRQSQPSGPRQWCKRLNGVAPKIESNTVTAALKNVIFICASTGDQYGRG
jgi:hypothetical protein